MPGAAGADLPFGFARMLPRRLRRTHTEPPPSKQNRVRMRRLKASCGRMASQVDMRSLA